MHTMAHVITITRPSFPDLLWVYPHPVDGRMLLSPWEETIDSRDAALAVFYRAMEWWDAEDRYYTITLTGPGGHYRSHAISPKR
jgi:hypothetical protein